jgi:hypothetical protein
MKYVSGLMERARINPQTSCWKIKEQSIGKASKAERGNTLKSFQCGVFSFQQVLTTEDTESTEEREFHQLSFEFQSWGRGFGSANCIRKRGRF